MQGCTKPVGGGKGSEATLSLWLHSATIAHMRHIGIRGHGKVSSDDAQAGVLETSLLPRLVHALNAQSRMMQYWASWATTVLYNLGHPNAVAWVLVDQAAPAH